MVLINKVPVYMKSSVLISLLAILTTGCSSLSQNAADAQPPSQRADITESARQAEGEGLVQAGEVIPEQASVQFTNALTAMQAGQLDVAQSYFSKMTLEYPELSGPYSNLGLIALSQGNTEIARGYLEKAIELNADNTDAYVALGLIERKVGHFQKAEQRYLQALANNAENASVHLNLGILYDLYMGRLEQAVVHYKAYQALQAAPVEQVKFWIVDIESRL